MKGDRKAEAKVELALKKSASIAYVEKLRKAKAKTEYITSLTKGRFFLERCNMMAEQLKDGGEISENVDGCMKSKGYLMAEYAMTKVQAINLMRQVFFMKEEMAKEFEMEEKDFLEVQQDYYDGKIIRESYSDEYRKKDKARFVQDFKENNR